MQKLKGEDAAKMTEGKKMNQNSYEMSQSRM